MFRLAIPRSLLKTGCIARYLDRLSYSSHAFTFASKTPTPHSPQYDHTPVARARCSPCNHTIFSPLPHISQPLFWWSCFFILTQLSTRAA